MSTTIQIRIDQKTKQNAREILERLGIDMSTAINLYFRQIIINQGIPFDLQLTENGLTRREEAEILEASREAKMGINVTKAMKPKEALEHLKRLRSIN